MTHRHLRLPSHVLQRYALGLARDRALAPEPDSAAAKRRRFLVRRLRHAGIKGWPERQTLYTRNLPKGCRPCLQGRGSNLVMTLLCNRECFFCFNPKPRVSGMSVHGCEVRGPKEAAELLAGLGVKSVGISGGEPLLEKRKVLALARGLRGRFGKGLRIDLYTNADLLTLRLLRSLKAAGVDGLRMNLAANGYGTRPVALARQVFDDVEVEIPAIPEHKDRVLRLMGELERMGCRHLILHELFSSAQNVDALARQGRRAKAGPRPAGLTWSAVAGSEETALGLLGEALERKLRLSVYYCSCGTQSWIAERAGARRQSSPSRRSKRRSPCADGAGRPSKVGKAAATIRLAATAAVMGRLPSSASTPRRLFTPA